MNKQTALAILAYESKESIDREVYREAVKTIDEALCHLDLLEKKLPNFASVEEVDCHGKMECLQSKNKTPYQDLTCSTEDLEYIKSLTKDQK